MRTGRVRTWREDRGFGFIRPDDSRPNLFVHVWNVEIVEALPVGESLQFNERPSRKKIGILEAYDVVIRPLADKCSSVSARPIQQGCASEEAALTKPRHGDQPASAPAT